jgi:cytochrome c oxidase subunit 2
MVPGLVTYFWITPTRTGTFDILCAELCGVGHPHMRGQVVVAEEGPYRVWLAKQQTFAELSAQVRTQKASLAPDR